MGTVVLIPSYNPQEVLIKLVRELCDTGLEVLVVNDGSGEDYKWIFDKVREYAAVVEYESNRGKGYALKAGIRWLAMCSEVDGFVTADGDGQHKVEDIIRVVNILEREKTVVLGVRNLTKDTPLRSRIGNDMSKITYTLAVGRYLKDNQSGLRGFTMDMAGWLLKVGGSHYEYEMNVLVKAALKGCPIIEVPIETIYEDNNSASHFRPFIDTVRLQSRLLVWGIVPSIIYIVSVIVMYLVSGRMGIWPWSAVCNGGFWLIHCLYGVAVVLFMHNPAVIGWVIGMALIKHIVLGGVFTGMFLLTENVILCIIVPLIMVLIISYFMGRFRRKQVVE